MWQQHKISNLILLLSFKFAIEWRLVLAAVLFAVDPLKIILIT